MNECSTKEEQENKFFLSDALNLQLINLSINGKYEQLKIFLEKYSPNKAEIDLAIRKCLYKFKSSNINYCNTLKELFRYADLNYCNPIFDNSNLLMHICAKSNTYIFDLIFEQNFMYGDENKKNKNKQNNKNNIKGKNSYVDINLYLVDKNNNNLFHYLFNDMNNQKDIIEAITKIMNYKGKNNDKIYSLENKKYLFTQPNNDGITPIIIILQKGFVNILTEIYKYIDYQKYEIPSTKNNLIHCAIEGKNIKCIKKMLNYTDSIEELKSKNKEGYTPSSYAKTFGFYMVKKLVEEVEKNFDNKEYKDILLSIKDVDIYDVLGKYMVIRNNCYITSNIESIQSIIKKDYKSIIYNLKKYELDISIDEPNYFYLPCKWNILLSETQM
jgi:ankyrin repeat protein